MGLRPYQANALKAIKDARDRGVNRQLVVKATGTGKTVLFANMPRELEMTAPTIVLAHREELVKQAADKIQKWNPERRVTVEMADRRAEKGADIVVASTATLYATDYRRLNGLVDDFGGFGLVVPDEAHHYLADKYIETVMRLLASNEDSLLVGVTATPNRTDNQAMGQLFDEIVFQYSMREAIQDGYLADVRGWKLTTATDISGVKTQAGDFQVKALEKAVNTAERNEEIVDTWLSIASTRQTLAFCVDIQHAKDLAFAFQRRGIPAEAVWGTDKDRAKKLAAHASGHLKVITNCNVLTEGYDDWRIGCVIMARPTKSQLLYVQMAGRGTRIPDGIDNLLTARQAGVRLEKEDCIILDVVDVTGRHSLVTLPSLFGLTPKMDLKGQSVMGAVTAAESLMEKHPDLDLSKIEDIDDLKEEKIVERVDLFEVKFAPEVEAHSQLAWYTSPFDGSFNLNLPTHERVTVKKSLNGKWTASGTVNGTRVEPTEYPDAAGAFLWAELNLSQHGRDFINLLKRSGAWRNDPASSKQIAQLVRWKLAPLHIAQSMTKAQAGVVLSKKFLKFKPKTNVQPKAAPLSPFAPSTPVVPIRSDKAFTGGKLDINPEDFNI